MKTTGDVIALYRDWQDALARHGVTDVATDEFWQLCKQIEADPLKGSKLCLNVFIAPRSHRCRRGSKLA